MCKENIDRLITIICQKTSIIKNNPYICLKLSRLGCSNMIGIKIREYREKNNLLLRQVAASLEIDTATLSKMERGIKPLNRELLKKISVLYSIDYKTLLSEWLADRLLTFIANEEKDISINAIRIVEKQITKI